MVRIFTSYQNIWLAVHPAVIVGIKAWSGMDPPGQLWCVKAAVRMIRTDGECHVVQLTTLHLYSCFGGSGTERVGMASL